MIFSFSYDGSDFDPARFPAPRKVISCILVERIVFANGTGALNANQVLLPGIP